MTVPPALVAALSGLSLGLGLIVAIGAQSAFVLRQGLRFEPVAAVVAVCTLSDVALIPAGVLGAGSVVARVPWLVPLVRFGGSAFLLGYAALAVRRALRPGALLTGRGWRALPEGRKGRHLPRVTWLNPHVYLDTVVLLGCTAATFGTRRWEFGAGAAR